MKLFRIFVLLALPSMTYAMFSPRIMETIKPVVTKSGVLTRTAITLYNLRNKRFPFYKFQEKETEKHERWASPELTIQHGNGNIFIEGYNFLNHMPTISIKTYKQGNTLTSFARTQIFKKFCNLGYLTHIKTSYVDGDSGTDGRNIKTTDKSALVDLFIRVNERTPITVSALHGNLHFKNIHGKIHATNIAGNIIIDNCKSAVHAKSKVGNIYIKNDPEYLKERMEYVKSISPAELDETENSKAILSQ